MLAGEGNGGEGSGDVLRANERGDGGGGEGDEGRADHLVFLIIFRLLNV